MLGVLLASIGTFFEEVASSIGKRKVATHEEGIFTMGFLHFIWGLLLFAGIAVFRDGAFVFSAASLPTFVVRAMLEIFQLHLTLVALASADRTTFGFVRTGTIPILLLLDVAFGYTLGASQAIGIGFIMIALVALFLNHGIRRPGLGFVIATTVNAALTLSLYKYHITHFNSVAAEQLIINVILLCYTTGLALFVSNERPWRFLARPIFLIESLASGIGSVIESFAFGFAPASIVLAAKRSSSVFWATVSGNVVFHERHLLLKLSAFLLLATGLVLLVR